MSAVGDTEEFQGLTWKCVSTDETGKLSYWAPVIPLPEEYGRVKVENGEE